MLAAASDFPRLGTIAITNGRVPSRDRLPVLDGIRGIAILLVMTFHFWMVGIAGGSLLRERVYGDVAGMGWMGVDLFFVLSGFLITGILYDSREASHYFRVFYARRTVRIFPLYYAALAIFLLVGPLVLAHLHRTTLASIHSTSAASLFSWTYLLNWYMGLKGWDAVARPLVQFWSLAVEEQFYLIWPFLVLKLPRRRLMGVCAGLMVLAFTLRAVMYWLQFPYASYTWTICRADSLAIGAIVALAVRHPDDWKKLLKWSRRLALPALAAVISGRINCSVGPGNSPTIFMNTFGLTLVGIFFGATLALAVALHQESPWHHILASPFLRFLGKYSYCLYVCHMPVIVLSVKGRSELPASGRTTTQRTIVGTGCQRRGLRRVNHACLCELALLRKAVAETQEPARYATPGADFSLCSVPGTE